MVRLVVLNNPRLAQAFIDYMAERNIEIKMQPEGEGQFALWLVDSEHQVETEAELTRFKEDPMHSRYQAASWHVADSREAVFDYSAPSFWQMIKAKAGVVTILFMVLCVGIYSAALLGWGQIIFQALHFPDSSLQKWQVWRWFSHAFLHFSLTHIAFNLLWWWQLGGDIEKKLGSGKLLQLFVLSSALSGLSQYWVEGANFGGLSGVVYALAGYLWITGLRRPSLGIGLPNNVMIFMFIWLVLGYIQPFFAIANSAHLSGLVLGIVLSLCEGKEKPTKAIE